MSIWGHSYNKLEAFNETKITNAHSRSEDDKPMARLGVESLSNIPIIAEKG